MAASKWCKEQLGISRVTTVKWSSRIRDAIAKELNRRPIQKIGGHGHIVEVDETLFSKRKNNAGRLLPVQWIVGGICRETKKCFLRIVQDRSADTLLGVIKDNIADGSTIFSDCWKGYRTSDLESSNFQHFTVNHRYNFIDPTTKVHTQTIERMWGSMKWRNKRQRGTARAHLESYLIEFIWRQEVTPPLSVFQIKEKLLFFQIGEKDPFLAVLNVIKNAGSE